jgi:hypothetical protein
MAKMKEIDFMAIQNTSAQFKWEDGWIMWNKINEIIPVINVLIKEHKEWKEPCSMCSEFKKGRKWLVSKGNGME